MNANLKTTLHYDFAPADLEMIFGIAAGAAAFTMGARKCVRMVERGGVGSAEAAETANAMLDGVDKALGEIRRIVRQMAPTVSSELAVELDRLEFAANG